MAEITVTLNGCELDCIYSATGGKFKGDHMQPADPIEVEVESIDWNGITVTDLIEACGKTQEVESLIRETL